MMRVRLFLTGFVAVSVAATAFFVGTEILSPGAQAGASDIVVLRGRGESVPVIGDGSSAITVVERTEDARAIVGESTRALLVTEAALKGIEAAWVRETMQTGVVLGGINLTTIELRNAFDVVKPLTQPDGEIVASPGEETDFDTAGQPFFTLLYEVTRDDGGGSRGGSTGLLSSEEALLRQIDRMAAAVENANDRDGSR